jgi:cytochrome c peroxidase
MTGGEGGVDPVGTGGEPSSGAGGVAGAGGSEAGAAGVGGSSDDDPPEPYGWQLPVGFPTPLVPSDNPMSRAKVELGRHLFYDKRLSGNETQSCSSCHLQALAFTDGRASSVGSTGQVHPRNAQSLANVAYQSTLTWANPLLFDLEDQALVPMFGLEPVELGLHGLEDVMLSRLEADPAYGQLFADAFPGDGELFTLVNVVRALASFQRTLISGGSPYDRFLNGDEAALSESARRGLELFGSERLECFHCHQGFNFQDSSRYVGKTFREEKFHNTGLYNLEGKGLYPAPNRGVYEVTLQPADMGRFRVPTLRNIAVTAPYMHDGSVLTLDAVLDHYAAGGRTIESGPYAGVGSENRNKSSFMVGFSLSAAERADLLAFFESLTDADFLRDSRFADPFQQ